METASRSVKPPTLEALLSGVSPDDVEEFRETLRDKKIRFSEKRQRLRGRLARILAQTVAMYEKELVHAKRPGVRFCHRHGPSRTPNQARPGRYGPGVERRI